MPQMSLVMVTARADFSHRFCSAVCAPADAAVAKINAAISHDLKLVIRRFRVLIFRNDIRLTGKARVASFSGSVNVVIS